MDEGFQYDGLTELIVTEDMAERKAKMIELGMPLSPFRAARGHWRRSQRSYQRSL